MKNIQDIQILFIRNLKKTFKSPWWMIGLAQPILYLLLYMPLLKNIGGTAALSIAQIAQIFVPGMLVIMGISNLFAGFGFIPEIRTGYIARLLVSPVSRTAIMASLILNQLVSFGMQAIVLTFIAFILGLRVTFLGLALTFILILLIGASMSALSYVISIGTKNETGLATIVNTIYLPVMLLSGILLPISLAPDWLKKLAHINPFYYAVEATRSLFLGHYGDRVVLEGFAVMIVFIILFSWIAVRSLKNMTT